MKKKLLILLCIAATTTLFACGGSDERENSNANNAMPRPKPPLDPNDDLEKYYSEEYKTLLKQCPLDTDNCAIIGEKIIKLGDLYEGAKIEQFWKYADQTVRFVVNAIDKDDNVENNDKNDGGFIWRKKQYEYRLDDKDITSQIFDIYKLTLSQKLGEPTTKLDDIPVLHHLYVTYYLNKLAIEIGGTLSKKVNGSLEAEGYSTKPVPNTQRYIPDYLNYYSNHKFWEIFIFHTNNYSNFIKIDNEHLQGACITRSTESKNPIAPFNTFRVHYHCLAKSPNNPDARMVFYQKAVDSKSTEHNLQEGINFCDPEKSPYYSEYCQQVEKSAMDELINFYDSLDSSGYSGLELRPFRFKRGSILKYSEKENKEHAQNKEIERFRVWLKEYINTYINNTP